jgi:hypothetical protein
MTFAVVSLFGRMGMSLKFSDTTPEGVSFCNSHLSDRIWIGNLQYPLFSFTLYLKAFAGIAVLVGATSKKQL